jgi:glutamate racemase
VEADGLGHAGYRTAVPLSAAQAIGVFDSGVGGLTVLDECLAALPSEDFVYFGDTAFFPYGEKGVDELRRRALAVARWLDGQGVKLILVACNTATAAVLPWLQQRVGTPVIGVMGPEAHAAVQATRNRRIGLLATEATVRSGSYERMVHANDAGVEVTSVACPRLAPAIQSGDPFDQEIVDMVREYAAPLVAARVDTVILGCTHYPMVERLLRRSLPGVTLIKSGEEIAREVGDTLVRKGLARSPGAEGSYRFACSGDADAFRELGSRFLQMPLGAVASVDPEVVPAAGAVRR